MDLHLARRWRIYVHGTDGLKETTIGLLLAWRNVPHFARRAWRTSVDLFWDMLPLLFALLGPLFFWLAPVIAFFTAYIEPTEEELRARFNAQRARMAQKAAPDEHADCTRAGSL
jgi:hypothetical protein